MPLTAEYWERRYRSGGTSGPGSAGAEAAHKAATVNQLLAHHGVRSILDLGCGDGVVAEQLTSAVPYVGHDLSLTAITRCRARMPDRPFCTKLGQERADLTLSLDVIFHLVTEEEYHAYLTTLFARADRFALVYGWQKIEPSAPHVRHRLWLEDVPDDWNVLWQQTGPFKNWWLFSHA
jgi:cyclopropane fatty-acyl-phospholipid synthase-like methyltransferase